MLVSLSEASRLTGKSKSLISNALKKGIISYVSKDLKGYKIDTSELFRVFEKRTEEPVLERPERTIQNPIKNGQEREIFELKIKHLEEKLRMMEEKIDYLKAEKDKWEQQSKYWRQLNFLKLKPSEPVEDREELIKRVQKDAITQYKAYLNK